MFGFGRSGSLSGPGTPANTDTASNTTTGIPLANTAAAANKKENSSEDALAVLRKDKKALETQAKHALATHQQLQTENDKLAREIESLRASSSTKSLETELTLLRKQNKELTAQQATTAKSSAIPIPTSFSRIPTCKSIPSSGRATPDSTNVSLLERLNVLESEASLAQTKITELNVLQRSKDAEIQRLHECLQNVREEYRKADELVTKMVEVDGRNACGMCTEQSVAFIQLESDKNRVDKELRELKEQFDHYKSNHEKKDELNVDEKAVLLSLEQQLRQVTDELTKANSKISAAQIEDQMQVDEIEEMQDQLESYRTKVVSLENEKKTLLEQSQQLHVELAAAKELTSQQSVQLDSSAVEISTLLNKLSDSSAAHNLTSEKLKATEMELRRTISTMEEIKRTAKTQLLQAEQFVNQQNHTISVVKEREAVTTGKFKAVEAELTRTKELHSQLQEQYDSANESLGAITSEISVLRSNAENLTAENTVLKTVIEHQKAELLNSSQTAAAHLESIQQELAQSQTRIFSLSEDLKQAHDSLKLAEHKRSSLERVKQTLDFEKQELKSQCWSLEKEKQELAKEVSDVECQNSALNEQITAKEASWSQLQTSLEAQRDQLTMDIQTLNQQIQAQEEAQLTAKEQENSRLSALNQEKSEVQTSLDSVLLQLSNAEKQISDLEMSLSSSREVESAWQQSKAALESERDKLLSSESNLQKMVSLLEEEALVLKNQCVEEINGVKESAQKEIQQNADEATEKWASLQQEFEVIQERSAREVAAAVEGKTQLEGQLKEFTGQMELVKQQCASLEMQLKMVADELSGKEQELERVRSAAGDSNSAIAEVNESRRLLELQIGELTERISEKEDQAKAMERLWADCKEKLSVAESNLAVSEDTAAEAQDELSEVKEKAKELKSRLSAAILELNGRDEELSQLKQKKLDLEEQISALLAKASGDESLQCRALSDAHNRIQILTTELAETTTLHSSELQERIKYFDEEKLNLNQELKRAEDELSALRAENEKAIGECRSRLNSQVDDLNTRLGVALGLSADLEKQCSILTETLTTSQRETTETADALNRANDQISSLQKEYVVSQQRVVELEKSLQESCSSSAEQIQELTQTRQTLESRMLNAEKEAESLTAEVEVLNFQISNMVAEKEGLENEKRELESRATQLDSEVVLLRQKAVDSESESVISRDLVRDLEGKVAHLEGALLVAEENHQRIELEKGDIISAAEKRINEMQKEGERLVAQVEELSSLKDAHTSLLESHSSQTSSLTSKVRDAESLIADLEIRLQGQGATIKKYQEEISDLAARLTVSESKFQQAEANTSNAESVIKTLQTQLELLAAAEATAKQNAEAVEQDMQRLKSELAGITVAYASLSETHANQSTDFAAKMQDAVAEIESHQSTIAFQTTSLTEQEQEIAELKQKLSAAEANLEVSEDSASDAEATCRQLENKLEVLEASLADKAGLLDGAQQKIRELSETMSLMESESKKSLSELREQQSILEKREADLTQYISGEKQRTEAIHKELIASKEALEGSYLYLESQLSDSQTELLTLRTASENFEVCEANLKQKISELETEVERLLAQFNAERAVAAESLVAMEDANSANAMELKEKVACIGSLEEELRRCHARMAEKNLEIQSLEERVADLNSKMTDANAHADCQASRITQLGHDMDVASKKVADLGEQIRVLEEELVTSRSLVANQAQAIEENSELLKKREEEWTSIHLKLEHGEQALASKTARLQELQIVLKEREDVIHNLNTRMDEFVAQSETFQSERASLLEKIDKLQQDFESLEDEKVNLVQDLDIRDRDVHELELKIQELLSAAQNDNHSEESALRVASLEMKVQELGAAVEEKSFMIKQFEEALILAQKLLDERDEHIGSLKESVESVKVESVEASNKWQTRLAEQQALVNELQQKVEDAVANSNSLSGDLADERKRTLVATSELEAAKAQILALSEFESLLTQKLQALEVEGASKAEEVLRLQTRCADLESIQTQLKRAEEELENLRSQLREHSCLSDSFNEKLVLAAERESNLTAQLNESNSKLDSMKELVDSSGIEIQRLRNECLSLSEAAALVGSVVLEVEGLKSELEQKTKEISQHEETVAELETTKVALNSSLQASVAEVARLSTLNTEVENSCLSHMSRMTALEQELSAKSKALSTIEERLSSALLEKDALIESLKESAKELTTRYEHSSKEIESKLREAASVIESMTSKVAVLEEELGIARQKSDTVSEGLRSELTELQASLDSMRSKLEESTNVAVEYEKRAQENEERNQILQDSSIALTRENKKLLVVKQKLERNVEKLQRQLEAASTTHASAGAQDPETTPTGSKRQSVFSPANPAKVARTVDVPVGIPVEAPPQVAIAAEPQLPAQPTRTRRHTLAARKVTEQAKDGSKPDCVQQ